MVESAKFAYMQIIDSLTDQIENGQLKPSEKLPSERDLSLQLGVSRMTVRRAINDLVTNGLVYRKQGSGTFVAEPKIEQHADVLIGFSESMQQKGMKPGAKVLSMDQVPASKKIANILRIDIGKPLYYIHRLRLANDEPIALEYSYFPVQCCPGIESYDLEVRSIYDILEENYDISLTTAEQSLEPVVANEYEAEILSVQVGAPLMLVRRVAFNHKGDPIEYAKDIFRGDRSRFISKSIMRC